MMTTGFQRIRPAHPRQVKSPPAPTTGLPIANSQTTKNMQAHTQGTRRRPPRVPKSADSARKGSRSPSLSGPSCRADSIRSSDPILTAGAPAGTPVQALSSRFRCSPRTSASSRNLRSTTANTITKRTWTSIRTRRS